MTLNHKDVSAQLILTLLMESAQLATLKVVTDTMQVFKNAFGDVELTKFM
jgi:hypothetical protein